MAKRPNASSLTKLELRVMQAIWRLGPSSVTVVQEALTPPLAYTTVQTMLNILERKGQLKRHLEGRAYIYTAVTTEAKATGQMLRDLIDRMFGGSSEQLVMSLVKSRHLDAETLAELSRKLEQDDKGDEA